MFVVILCLVLICSTALITHQICLKFYNPTGDIVEASVIITTLEIIRLKNDFAVDRYIWIKLMRELNSKLHRYITITWAPNSVHNRKYTVRIHAAKVRQ